MLVTKSMFPRQEVGRDAGLATLAKAVEMELATKSGTKTVSFFVMVFVCRHVSTPFAAPAVAVWRDLLRKD